MTKAEAERAAKAHAKAEGHRWAIVKIRGVWTPNCPNCGWTVDLLEALRKSLGGES